MAKMNVIEIRFHEALPTKNQDKLRCRMELAVWRARWRKAKEEKDYHTMAALDREYELVGLP
jgi:hypothetical protein